MMQPNTVMDQEAANATPTQYRLELPAPVTLLHPLEWVPTCSKAAHNADISLAAFNTHTVVATKIWVVTILTPAFEMALIHAANAGIVISECWSPPVPDHVY